jgi:hypothetical protein
MKEAVLIPEHGASVESEAPRRVGGDPAIVGTITVHFERTVNTCQSLTECQTPTR